MHRLGGPTRAVLGLATTQDPMEWTQCGPVASATAWATVVIQTSALRSHRSRPPCRSRHHKMVTEATGLGMTQATLQRPTQARTL